MEVIPLSVALPVMGAIILCVWAVHRAITPPETAKSTPGLPVYPETTKELILSVRYLLCGFAAGLPVSSYIRVGGSPVSNSNLRALVSTSARRSIGSTLALSSLISTVARHPTSSARLLHPSALTWSVIHCLHLRTTLLWLHLIPSSLWLHWAPPSLRLHLGPLSLQIHRGLLDPRLGCQSHRLCPGPLDPQCQLGSAALRLCPGVLLCLRQSAHWSCQPFLHHGSSFHWLHRGPPSWLQPGSCLHPPWFLPLCAPPWTVFVVLLQFFAPDCRAVCPSLSVSA
ncbi:uncharacterized protein LOC122135046 [Cyprinus carpio]|uniref:Uncharacterized protein LOC122135046 n=1 Tax=Cyprinus carpio TaxID=7962 RepID=A0A9Q9VNS8_CYPCA|nr:uncharacterized protein LOC122135046 [Cyprinus carpio]